MSKSELYTSIAALQHDVDVFKDDTSGFGYKYTTLGSIVHAIKPHMKKHNLGYTQAVKGDYLQTTIFHTKSGEEIKASIKLLENVKLGNMNPFQVMGSQITYLRRYQLTSMLGLVTEKDDDAATPPKKQPTPPPAKLPALTPSHAKWETIKEKINTGETTIKVVEKHFAISDANIKKLTGND